ncbi:MAG: extracellular solute-binding protein, partial [Planctomycetes bacterium]|nr:extracellular solute-binding protein [Planctomycetota bacterium]
VRNYREIAARFERENPDIELLLQDLPWGDYWTKLKTQAAGRNAPDIIRMYTGEAAAWYERDVLADLRPFVERDGLRLSDYYDVAIQAVRWGDKVFGLPTDIAIRIFMYDKDLFDRAGVPYLDPRKPLTWDELVAVAKRLTAREGPRTTQYGLSLGYQPVEVFVSQAGGQVVDQIVNPRRVLVDTDAGREGLAFYQDLIHKHRVAALPSTQQDSGFGAPDFALLSGKVAIAHCGPWALSDYVAKKSLRFGLAPVPVGKQRSQVCTVNSCGVYRHSRHPEAAWKFVKFLATEPGQGLIAGLGVGVPTLKAVAESDLFLKGSLGVPDMAVFLDEVKHARTNIMVPRGEFDRERRRILEEQLALGTVSPAAAAAELQRAGNAALSPPVRRQSPAIRYGIPSVMLAALAGVVALLLVSHRRLMDVRPWEGAGRADHVSGYLFVLPWLVGFLLFMAGPIAASMLLSFSEWDIFSPPRWVGAENFARLCAGDPSFAKSLAVTILYVVFSLPIQLLGGLGAAMLLQASGRGASLGRAILYLPFLFSGVALSFVWLWMYNPDYGLINYFLRHLGVEGPNWLLDERSALPAMILMNLLWVGGNMIIFQAGLRNIPETLYEAAEVDGASGWSQFVHITIPMLTPTILFNLIMGTISSFQVFTQAYVMTKGGPNRATLFYVLHLYDKAFQDFEMGYACALAVILFAVIFAFTCLQLWSSRRWVYYEV